MAGFGDSNDIKINVTLDTESAIKSAQELKVAIESSLKVTEQQFNKIKQVATQLSSALDNLAKAEVSGNKEKLNNILSAEEQAAKKEVVLAEEVASKKAKAAQKAASLALEAEKARIRELETLSRREAEQEKTRRTQLLKDIAQLNKDRAVIRKTPRAELPSDLGGVSGAGKLLDALGKSAAGIGVQFGNVNVVVGTLLRNLIGLGGPVGTATAALAALKFGLDKFNASIDETAQAAGKLEGLKTGFETLQRSIGQAPLASINKLREATQGLISDTDLYQRANQAVLLGVPTDTFNEAAAAAVKLGRAMGIDASFGLESLSLGLGRQSRLYLDNLGIVVSAEEAYRNFGLSVGKSAADLSDAEKKAAFFAEALRKIKERADELPDPIDSVAIAQQKANVAQENANQQFLEGFNASKNLAEQYAAQRANSEVTAKSAYVYGAALAEVGARAKSLANGVASVGVVIKTGFGEALDFVFRLSPEKKIADLNGEIETTRKRIEYLKTTIPATGELGLIARSNKAEIERLNQSLAEKQKALDGLKVTLNELDGKNVNIKLAIEGIDTAQSQISALFATLGKEAEQEAGIFKIAGLPDAQAAEVFSKYKQAKEDFDSSLNKTEALEKYKAALKGIEEQVGGTAIKTAATNLATDVTNLATALGSGQFSKAGELFRKAGDGILEVAKSSRSASVSIKDLENGFKGIAGQIKKTSTEGKRASSAATKDLKQQQQGLVQFSKTIRKALSTAIPDDIQRELVDLFKNSGLTAEQFSVELEKLGQKAKDSGVDLQALADEVKDLQALIDKGVKPIDIKVNAKTTEGQLQGITEQGKKAVVDIRKALKDIGLEFGTEGGFFGFDFSNILGDEATQKALADQISSAIGQGVRNLTSSLASEDYEQAARDIGATIGAIAGAAIEAALFGSTTGIGASIGAVIGSEVGKAIYKLGGDGPGTRERKSIDSYFAKLFEGGKLPIIDAIRDIFGTAIVDITNQADVAIRRISDLSITGSNPIYFQNLSTQAQAAFNGIAIAFTSLLGVSSQQAQQLAVALASNLGGSLQNLQVLIQQTGESIEDLSEAVVKAFLNAQISIEQAYNSLLQLQGVMEEGIPGAVGDYTQAIRNFTIAIREGAENAGAFIIDSFRDIGSEAAEATGASFTSVVTQWANSIGFTGDKVQLFFQLLARAGITSFEQLRTAGNRTIISIAEGIRQIREGLITSIDDLNKFPILTEPPKTSSGPKPSGPKKKTPQEVAAELLAKQREEAVKLLRESQKYLDITDQINKGLVDQLTAGKALVGFEQEILKAIIERDKKEKELNKELAKGSKANAERVAELSAKLRELQDFLKGVTDKANSTNRAFKQLNLASVIPFIKSANMLGVIATQVGVSFDKASEILVKGFLQGRLSLKELREEMERTKETLGPGIPNAVGAVTDAFQGLIDAGTQGGQFSVDAFRDIFAEFREKFQKEGSALREAERKQLEENLKAARDAFANAVGPEATAAAKKTLDEAKKALDDFYATVPAPDLADLRSQLTAVFGAEEVDKFFQALGESGLTTFEDFEKAGTDSIVGILQKLQELGFNFGETSKAIIDANKAAVDAETEANAGLDPLQEAINLIKGLNDGAAQLPPVFNDTTAAIQGLNGPLTALSNGFDDILEKLSLLSGQTFKNDVVFNVSTVGEPGAQALVDIIFGDGSDTTTSVSRNNSGNSDSKASEISRLKKEIQRLQKKTQTKAIRDRIATLKKRIAELKG